MLAHEHDLRAEVGAELASKIREDWRRAPIDSPTRILLAFAEKLTLTPSAMTASDLDVLRGEGFSDRAIHDAAQAAAYFNYINRVADALGVDPEPWMETER